MNQTRTKNIKLTRKITVSFLLLMILVGTTYVLTTIYFTNKHVEETTQNLNSNLANHIIDEKFKNDSPFLDDGSVNKELFGDLMHDMMAVNRGIEVYLIDLSGEVLYSVVLDHEKSDAPVVSIDTAPIDEFIKTKGKKHIVGDDPRVPDAQKIFSAAKFESKGREAYIYIVLASKDFEDVTASLSSSYFMRLGIGASILTILFAVLVGFIAIRYLTRNLRDIIFAVRRFKEGDMSSRIPESSGTDMEVLANTFNEMADSIEDHIEEGKSIEKLRRELTANISHDLRSPIAVSQGYIETMIMKNGSLSMEQQEEYLNIVHNSMQRLTKLVERLFEYSKFEANQVKLEKEPFKIEELASDILANYKMSAEPRSIELSLSADDSIPLVFADISLVERVFQNLIDNALNHTPDHGKIHLMIKVSENNVELLIQDSGSGIPKKQLNHIFERYEHGDKKGGTGLGLAIVKKILDLHESTVSVISNPEKGTTFQFSLPVYSQNVSLSI